MLSKQDEQPAMVLGQVADWRSRTTKGTAPSAFRHGVYGEVTKTPSILSRPPPKVLIAGDGARSDR